MAGKRPTDAEVRERVQVVAELIKRGFYDTEIVTVVCKKYRIPRSTCKRWYLSRARELLYQEQGFTKEELRAKSASFYHEIREDQKAMTKDRIRANERLDRLLGLEAPLLVKGDVNVSLIDLLNRPEVLEAAAGGAAEGAPGPDADR